MAKGRHGAGVDLAPEDKKKLSKDGLKKAIALFKFTLPYKNTYIIGMLFLVFSTVTTMVFPLLIGEMTKVMEGKSQYNINQVAAFFAVILVAQGIFSFFRVFASVRPTVVLPCSLSFAVFFCRLFPCYPFPTLCLMFLHYWVSP
jgi:ABC-type bacteriocin/lantibiotic exporter with double-glycine peptidase domain